MSFRGTIQNGRVVFDGEVALSNGTPVEVTPLPRVRTSGKPTGPKGAAGKKSAPPKKTTDRTGIARMLDLAVHDDAIPRDLASQHDHYIYGSPKRKTRPTAKKRSTRR